MNVLIFLLCVVAALAIHRAIVRPLFEAFEARKHREELRRISERAMVERSRRVCL
ncbi:hypothetical protein PM398_gp36 [Pseudomonas phage Epa40]|uniref:Uncharacterized protein n=1 Tax=Pseudomonas phage Epa40 TaxID=2719198 RepID=A0A6G9LK85_9CAUD|nr:hypothetical protein PM398_gp36 [Pseudomonas phage Epa40]QIQ66050.1 hypothetical protein 40_00036 [Pseudomonas phage Epa40]QIQ66102.1 hypothetical protein 41_00040 [Pseudomonas phage Epa41]